MFINSESEPSDQNHGLTLTKARNNYEEFGAVTPELKKHVRATKESEYPRLL